MDSAERLGVLGITVDAENDDAELWTAFASVIGETMVSKTAYGDRINRTRRPRGVTLAAEMRWALLPPLTFRSPYVEISGVLEPAYDIAGDTFDYSVNGNILSLAVLDAMGHGLEASQIANLAVSEYRRGRQSELTLGELLHSMDDVVASQFGSSRFVTGQLAEFDLRSGRLTVVNAGHPPPILFRGGRDIGDLPCRPCPPMGLGLIRTEEAHVDLAAGRRRPLPHGRHHGGSITGGGTVAVASASPMSSSRRCAARRATGGAASPRRAARRRPTRADRWRTTRRRLPPAGSHARLRISAPEPRLVLGLGPALGHHRQPGQRLHVAPGEDRLQRGAVQPLAWSCGRSLRQLEPGSRAFRGEPDVHMGLAERPSRAVSSRCSPGVASSTFVLRRERRVATPRMRGRAGSRRRARTLRQHADVGRARHPVAVQPAVGQDCIHLGRTGFHPAADARHQATGSF